MPVPVLIITPIRSFGQLIQQALHEIGSYKAVLTHSGAEAVEQAREREFALAVLDAGISDINLADLVIALRKAAEGLHLIGISIDETSGS
ncbi:MAG: hypothetical protein ACK2T5_13495, partial [Anaerolineales bacterium]